MDFSLQLPLLKLGDSQKRRERVAGRDISFINVLNGSGRRVNRKIERASGVSSTSEANTKDLVFD